MGKCNGVETVNHKPLTVGIDGWVASSLVQVIIIKYINNACLRN